MSLQTIDKTKITPFESTLSKQRELQISSIWYPGHIKKARELLKDNLKKADIIFEVLDARIPSSSKNPDIDELVGSKLRILILNKCDLSSKEGNKRWVKYFDEKKTNVIKVVAPKTMWIKSFLNEINALIKNRKANFAVIKKNSLCAMVVGIPNVGKSSMINTLAGRKKTKTGKRPGITTGEQVISARGLFYIIDTPGLLWPNLKDQNSIFNLSVTGAIKDEVLDIETLSVKLVEKLMCAAPDKFKERYNISTNCDNAIKIIEEIAIKRGCIFKKRNIDYRRVSSLIINEFRKGLFGKITLEYPS